MFVDSNIIELDELNNILLASSSIAIALISTFVVISLPNVIVLG